MIAAYDPLANSLVKPDRPEIVPPVAYDNVQMTEFVAYNDFIVQVVCNHDSHSNLID